MDPRIECLSKVIVKYQNPGISQMVVPSSLGGVIPHGTTILDLAMDLVLKHEREGTLDTLRNDLKGANPNPAFHTEVDECFGLDGVPAGGRPRWYDDQLVMNVPLINREGLRLSLYELLEHGQGSVRLMIVRGEYPGKSYCHWLINYVASKLGLEKPILINLLDISSVQELAEVLVDQLSLTHSEMVARFSSEIREGKYFNNWLVGQSRNFGAGKRWVLVFDHLAKPGVNQDVANAVLDLARRALEDRFTNVWVILLDCPITEAIDQPGRYYEESVEPLQRQEIELFVDWVKELLRQEDDLAPQVPNSITAALAGPFPLPKAELQRLQREIIDWLNR